MQRSSLFTISMVAHVAVAVGLGALQVQRNHTATAIEFAESKPKPEPPKAKPAPPKAPETPPPRRQPAARQAAAPAAPAALQANAPSFADAPDFGLALDGASGFGGIPVAMRAAPEAPVTKAPPTRLNNPAVTNKPGCHQISSKPRPLNVPPPVYPETARSGGIAGKVRVQLVIDELGNVTDVRLLQSLRRDFDEAALAAARRARFEPARECGKAAQSTFTIAMRFSAG